MYLYMFPRYILKVSSQPWRLRRNSVEFEKVLQIKVPHLKVGLLWISLIAGDLLPADVDRGGGRPRLLHQHALRRERHLLLALPARRQLVGQLHHLHVEGRQFSPGRQLNSIEIIWVISLGKFLDPSWSWKRTNSCLKMRAVNREHEQPRRERPRRAVRARPSGRREPHNFFERLCSKFRLRLQEGSFSEYVKWEHAYENMCTERGVLSVARFWR